MGGWLNSRCIYWCIAAPMFNVSVLYFHKLDLVATEFFLAFGRANWRVVGVVIAQPHYHRFMNFWLYPMRNFGRLYCLHLFFCFSFCRCEVMKKAMDQKTSLHWTTWPRHQIGPRWGMRRGGLIRWRPAGTARKRRTSVAVKNISSN